MNNRRISSSVKRLLRFVAYLLSVIAAVMILSLAVHHPIIAQTNKLEIIAEFPLEHPPGNIAITPQGRLMMSQHQF